MKPNHRVARDGALLPSNGEWIILMLYCPYCIKDKDSSQSHETFSPAGEATVDSLNKATIEFMVHSQGCGKLFLAVFGVASRDAMGCFELPNDWDQKPSYEERP